MKQEELWHLYCAKGEYELDIKDIYDRSLVQFSRKGEILNTEVSDFLVKKGFKPSYPEHKVFACCISHDIDILYPSGSLKELASAAYQLNPSRFWRLSKNKLSRTIDPVADLRNLFELEKKLEIHASYYFLAVERDNQEDFNYQLEEVAHYFPQIEKLGAEVGLHGSKLAYNNSYELEKELNRLKSFYPNITGYRNHYLKFEIPTSWDIFSKAGFSYDSSFGAPYSPGFRNGMCYPFQPYDMIKNEWIDIYEIPLIAMDVSFFNYLKLDYYNAFKLFRNLVGHVKSRGGVFSFLWHNNYMEGEMLKFYEKCLAYLVKQNAWFASGQELINWWKENEYFQEQRHHLESLAPYPLELNK